MLPKSKLMKLIPPGLEASRWVVEGEDLVVDAHRATENTACPACGSVSRQVHSRYRRTLRDLPAHGRRVLVRVFVRRFRCAEAECQRKTFAEPLADAVDGPYARRARRDRTNSFTRLPWPWAAGRGSAWPHGCASAAVGTRCCG